MECSNLQRQATCLKKSLFEQGYLDDQFYQLEELQDASSPNFVEEVVTLCFSNSSRLLNNIDHALERRPQDFCHLDNCMHQYKGSASSIGALKVKKECVMFQEYCDQRNIDGCMRTFERVKREHSVLRQKLEAYFQLLRQMLLWRKLPDATNENATNENGQTICRLLKCLCINVGDKRRSLISVVSKFYAFVLLHERNSVEKNVMEIYI